ncbi:MAG: AbrB/MazE/SpoVT family DNA-binding domain-containing protein [Desulfobacterales bacterium]
MFKTVVKVSKKGQIAIPRKVREKLNSDFLEVELVDDKVILRPVQSIASLGGRLKEYAKNRSASGQEDEQAWEIHVKEKSDRS